MEGAESRRREETETEEEMSIDNVGQNIDSVGQSIDIVGQNIDILGHPKTKKSWLQYPYAGFSGIFFAPYYSTILL